MTSCLEVNDKEGKHEREKEVSFQKGNGKKRKLRVRRLSKKERKKSTT